MIAAIALMAVLGGCDMREAGANAADGEAFNCVQEVSWHYPDPFSVRSIHGTTGGEAVTDYRENFEYDREGRLLHFRSTGTPLESPLAGDDDEDWHDQFIIDVSFTYDAQGKLMKKVYKHSSAWYMPFGTWFSWQVSHYDERERLAHTAVDPFSVWADYSFSGRSTAFLRDGMTVEEYFRELEPELYGLYFDHDEDGKLMHIFTGVTHGGVDNFYIYKNGWNGKESDRPRYMLEVDSGWGVTFYRFGS